MDNAFPNHKPNKSVTEELASFDLCILIRSDLACCISKFVIFYSELYKHNINIFSVQFSTCRSAFVFSMLCTPKANLFLNSELDQGTLNRGSVG